MDKRKFTTHDPLEDLLPTKGWLTNYVRFTNGLEACARFRFFTACSVLGAAINNKVWVNRGDPDLLPKLFPNPWVLLLAPPGRGHKTSTVNMGVNCLIQACPEVRILADKLTPESLVKALSSPVGKETLRIGPRDATGLIKAPELSVFFGKQQYNQGLVSLVTDLYDYRELWVSETIMRGKNVLKNNCISVLGASTPDWMHTMLPGDALQGGFLPRFVIVEMPPTYFKRIADPQKPTGMHWEDLVIGLRKHGTVSGEIPWGEGGLDAYRDYYINLIPTGERNLDAYQEREVEQMIRVAMLLSISQGRFAVEKEDMQRATKLLRCLMEETGPRIDKLTGNPKMVVGQEIKDCLKQYKSLSRAKLMKRVYRFLTYGEAQFNETLRMLCVMGDIERVGTSEYKIKGGEE